MCMTDLVDLPTATPEECKAAPGTFHPVVDARRCEGKGECAVVCPLDVFQVGRMADEVFDGMPTLSKIKLWVHGRKTAYTPNAEACQACGLCVTACPERAIRLVRSTY
jgi:4Fe-4S ferredoxin